jgi:membrane-associated phospholipid phosphatase
MDMWTAFSNIGDAAITLPVALVCAIWLAKADVRLAWRWALTLGFCMVLVGASKVLYYGWGKSLPLEDFRVISGHTMLSTAVWVVAFALQLRGWRWPVFPGIVAGMILGVLTGMSRIHGQDHSVSEVIVGWALGAIASCVFLRTALRVEYRQFRSSWFTICLLVVSTVTYGHEAPFQAMFEQKSAVIRAHTAAITHAISRVRARVSQEERAAPGGGSS